MEYISNAIPHHGGSVPARVLSGGPVTRASASPRILGRHQCIPHPSSVAIIPQRESQLSQAGAVISKIEDIFESIVDDLANGAGNLSIPYRSRTATARSRRQPGDDQPANAGARADGVVTFPGRTPHEAKKFGRIFIGAFFRAVSFLFLTFSLPCVFSCAASYTGDFS
jgi:hypothetical protein